MAKDRQQAALSARTGKPAPKKNQVGPTEERADGRDPTNLDEGDTEAAADAADQGISVPCTLRVCQCLC